MSTYFSPRKRFFWWRASVEAGRNTTHPSLSPYPYVMEMALSYRKHATLSVARTRPGIQILVVHRGSTRWVVGERCLTVKAGEALVTAPWEKFGGEAGALGPCLMSWIIIKPEVFEKDKKIILGPWSSLSSMEEKNLGRAFIRQSSIHLEQCSFWPTHFWGIQEELERGGRLSSPQVARWVSSLLFYLERCIRETQRQPDKNASFRMSKLSDAILRKIDHPWRNEEMAAVCGLDKISLHSFLKLQTGYSPHRFILFLKVRQAIEWIDSGRSMTQVAYDCGFSSQQHFSIAFKKMTGFAPSAWRRKTAGNPINPS